MEVRKAWIWQGGCEIFIFHHQPSFIIESNYLSIICNNILKNSLAKSLSSMLYWAFQWRYPIIHPKWSRIYRNSWKFKSNLQSPINWGKIRSQSCLFWSVLWKHYVCVFCVGIILTSTFPVLQKGYVPRYRDLAHKTSFRSWNIWSHSRQ